MKSMQSLLPLLCILYQIIEFVVADECTLHSDVHDLTKLALLKSISPLYGERFMTVSNGFTYDITICSDVSKEATQYESATKTCTNNCAGVHNKKVVLGRRNDTSISGEDGTFLLTYSGGDLINEPGHCNGSRWSTVILITCQLDTHEIVLWEDHSSGCFATFHLKTNVLCNVPEKFSRTTVFLLLLTTGIMFYLMVGVAYKRIVLGAKGIEQIPNYQFWSNLHGSCLDMCQKDGGERKDESTSDWSGRRNQNFPDAADEPLLHP